VPSSGTRQKSRGTSKVSSLALSRHGDIEVPVHMIKLTETRNKILPIAY
jgi:hypothetical protein